MGKVELRSRGALAVLVMVLVQAACATRERAPEVLDHPDSIRRHPGLQPGLVVDTVSYVNAAGETVMVIDTTRPFDISNLSRPLRPVAFPRPRAWRPLRHFGPFNEGSDLAQIQLLVSGHRATWYFNDYFQTLDPTLDPYAEEIFRIYYRNNLASDPLSAAVFPMDRTPVLPNTPGGAPRSITQEVRQGAAHNLLLELRQIAWSSRFGGSVAFHFEMAELEGPELNLQHEDDFEYEFVREDPGRDPESYRFDVGAAEVVLYVNPDTSFINPLTSKLWGNVGFGMELAVEDVRGYRGSHIMPAAESDSLLAEILAAVEDGMMSVTQGYWKLHASRFAHAWIHNQHQGLIDANDRVAELWISDEWSDLRTVDYIPYAYLRWRIDELSAEAAGGLFEGEEEWQVRVRRFQQFEGSDLFEIPDRDLHFEGNDRSSWVTLVALDIVDCPVLEIAAVRVRVREEDPLAEDPNFGAADRVFRLDCDPIIAQARQQFYVGQVDAAVLPVLDGASVLLDCDDESTVQLGTGVIDRGSACLHDDGSLRGRIPGGITHLGEALVFFASLGWRAEVFLSAR